MIRKPNPKNLTRHPPRRQSHPPHQRRRRAGKAFEPEQAPRIERVLQLWRGARSGNGGLTLCALSRTLPLNENAKARSKRLYRLLRNASLDGTEMTPLLVRLALGSKPSGWVPIVVDQ